MKHGVPLGRVLGLLPFYDVIFLFLPHLAMQPDTLTVAIDGKGCPGGGDLVVADLAVLRGAVLVCGLHLQDAVVNLAFRHCRPVLVLPEHRCKLVHIVDLNVHHRPANPDKGMDWIGSAFYSTANNGNKLSQHWSEGPERIAASLEECLPPCWTAHLSHKYKHWKKYPLQPLVQLGRLRALGGSISGDELVW